MKTIGNHYGVLGVSSGADAGTLRKAYRRLARKHHPDVSSDPRSNELMSRINEAFETLIDPDRRSEYDALLMKGLMDEPVAPREKKPVVVRLAHRLRLHRTPIYALGFGPDGLLVSSSFDNEIVWVDPRSGAVKRRMKLEGSPVMAIRNLAGGRMAAAGVAERQLSMWSIASEQVVSSRTAATPWLSCMSISPDGAILATGEVARRVAGWKIRDGKFAFQSNDHSASVTALAWSQSGKYLATGSADAAVKLRDGKTGAALASFGGVRSAVTALAFSPDDRYVIAASVDYSVRVMRLSDGMLQKVMFGHTKPIESLAFHPNSWLFASGGRDGQVHLWNAAEGLGQLQIDASHLAISNVAFSKDGRFLAAAGLDKTVRLWTIEVRRAS